MGTGQMLLATGISSRLMLLKSNHAVSFRHLPFPGPKEAEGPTLLHGMTVSIRRPAAALQRLRLGKRRGVLYSSGDIRRELLQAKGRGSRSSCVKADSSQAGGLTMSFRPVEREVGLARCRISELALAAICAADWNLVGALKTICCNTSLDAGHSGKVRIRLGCMPSTRSKPKEANDICKRELNSCKHLF